MDVFSSQEVVVALGGKAKGKSQLSLARLSLLGVMGGFFIALGYLSFVRMAGTLPKSWGSLSTLLGGGLFPIGLITLTFVGGELATGNMMVMSLGVLQKKISVKELSVNWLIVLVTNCLGGILVAYLFGHVAGSTEGAFLEKTVAVAQAKLADPPLVAFVSGIGCNLFVCLAVYLGAMAKTYLGKLFGLWFPVMVFVVCGFQHVVANAFIIPAALFAGASGVSWTGYLQNAFFVFWGNAIGGISLALALWLQTKEQVEKKEVGVYETT